MFGKNPRLTPLELRKQLLITESDLNRIRMLEDAQQITGGLRNLAGRMKTVGSIASAAAVLGAGVATFRGGKEAPTAAKPSWFQNILKCAQLASSFWFTFRGRSR